MESDMEQMDKLGADLVKAAEHGTPEQVKRLLEAGAPVDTTGPTGGGFTPLLATALDGYAEAAGLLLDCGADIESTGYFGRTALCKAAYEDHVDLAALLLRRGANPNTTDEEGWTPLMHAVKNGSAGVFRLLLDHGVDLHVESEVRLARAGGSAAASLLGIAYGSRG
ncbi:hypothetical protein FNF31_01993 [Cafeteria roenbergensis]|uniref:Uncharacterized protein n=1 Tax=Cafeteria roenbergensis TaxID=33653 RepID=A0A5A8DMY2_CAFRO|nr:hypothetical protein FNF31_01993 [Cafeteria roenbergensis]